MIIIIIAMMMKKQIPRPPRFASTPVGQRRKNKGRRGEKKLIKKDKTEGKKKKR